jgi:hypothetical protein
VNKLLVLLFTSATKENFSMAFNDVCTKEALKNKLDLFNKNLEGKEWNRLLDHFQLRILAS